MRCRGLGSQGNGRGGIGRRGVGKGFHDMRGQNGRMQEREATLGRTCQEGIGPVGMRRVAVMVLVLRGVDATDRAAGQFDGGIEMAMLLGESFAGMVILRAMVKQVRMIHRDMHLGTDAQPKRDHDAHNMGTYLHALSI